jgi:secreted PhoX family phosphatase
LFQNRKISALENRDFRYGRLLAKPSLNTGETFLALPEGFQYNVFGKAGATMTDGQPTPVLHDGMGCFEFRGNLVLIRNHEILAFAGSSGAVSGTRRYDASAGGGTTTLMIDKNSRLPIREFTSLSGTVRNCAGGMTPWNSWISCEETVVGTTSGFAKPHGYCFEVLPSTKNPRAAPIALTEMGRFSHEAVAVDARGFVYLTEDNNPAGFYRFVPNSYGQLTAGGQLQMLTVANQPNFDVRAGQTVGETFPVQWVDITDPNPPSAETDSLAVFNQGFARGAAVFARLEGCFAENSKIYFTSTNGGNLGLGQVWEYNSSNGAAPTLKMIFESPSPSVLNQPDNICIGQNGELFICDDNGGEIFVRVLNTDGMMSDFAKNIVPGFQTSEFTGSVFSPDRQTLFVNIQTPGLTFAIWGNW